VPRAAATQKRTGFGVQRGLNLSSPDYTAIPTPRPTSAARVHGQLTWAGMCELEQIGDSGFASI